ncbi:MAG: hypothetical protein ABJB98_08010 [Actinomycetota bacterium]
MTASELSSADPGVGPDGAIIELEVPAERAYVPVLRTLTAGLAARCDLTLDQIEDLRIAVDEACALLLPHVRAGDRLAARFRLVTGQLDFIASVPAEVDAEPDREGFAWTVLRALAEDVAVRSSDGVLAIELSKRRETQPQ